MTAVTNGCSVAPTNRAMSAHFSLTRLTVEGDWKANGEREHVTGFGGEPEQCV